MNDEDSSVEDVAEREPVEGVRKEVHGLVAVLGDDFPFEPVELVHVPAFVVASVHEEAVRVHELVDVEREDTLDRKRASVNEISVEEIRFLRGRFSVELEDVEQVVVLAVDVSADGEGLVAA